MRDPIFMPTSELIMELVAGGVVTDDPRGLNAAPQVTFTMGRTKEDLDRRTRLADELDRRIPRSIR